MAGGAAGAGAAAAMRAAMIQATRAMGVIVKVEEHEFLNILQRSENPIVVTSSGGLFTTHYHYLTSYKGLAFYAKSQTKINLPTNIELVQAKSIWVPG